MAREWKVIKALGPTAVPVPAALGFCDDKSVTGSLFYVMGFVAGHPLHNAQDTERFVPAEWRRGLAFAFFSVLAELHKLAPETIGLADLGRPEGYIARQITSWYRSWQASIGPAAYDDPRAHELQRFLVAHIPPEGPARVVHGDYGLHNCLVGENGRIAAVLDWEISTLGDPLADLAYALNQFPDPSEPQPPRPQAAAAAPGFPPRAEMAAHYAARTGSDLSQLDYYIGFNRWKSAAIVHGVYARYMEGKKETEGVNLEELRLSIGRSLGAAEAALARWKH
jgi:aminoglycoside phosphotransferase (APT) family kinase protein